MPNVIGLEESDAIARPEERGLNVGPITEAESDYPAGRIIWQSTEQGTEVEPGSTIYLQVSTGPAEESGETDSGGAR